MKKITQNLEKHFSKFRKNTIGYNQTFQSPYGKKKINYFDWTASGRLYGPIEDTIKNIFGPYVANTHTEASETGVTMTTSYSMAREIIKKHVHAGPDDVLLMSGTGMTGAINKLQRILGFKFIDQLHRYESLTGKKASPKEYPFAENYKPVVFITHMEHHSNQTSWEETIADVIVIPQDKDGLADYQMLKKLLKKYKNRKIKIGSFTACSNVTGIQTNYFKLAKIMHENGGYCFVDFAASAPYVNIDMHPNDSGEKLDAIFFSPHKFLGGPMTPGVLIFDKKLYPQGLPPDHPGGGTVLWTNPWGGRMYYNEIELREDGGTPGFLQTIRAALCIKLKEEMGVANILAREEYLLKLLITGLLEISEVHILAEEQKERLGIISFYVENLHYNLIVKLLNDRFGIQTRGGCSCAGTYGHCLLHVSKKGSKKITDMIDSGDQSEKPGWVRVSLHPTITDEEIHGFIKALKGIVANINIWKKDYIYNSRTNEFRHKNVPEDAERKRVARWFII